MATDLCDELKALFESATIRMLAIDLLDSSWTSIDEIQFELSLCRVNEILLKIPLSARNGMEHEKLTFSCGKNSTCNDDFSLLRNMIQFFKQIGSLSQAPEPPVSPAAPHLKQALLGAAET